LAINKDAVALKTGGTTSKITLADFMGTGASLKWPLVDGTELGLSLLGFGTPVVSAIEVAVDISQPSKSGAFKAYISGLVASMTSSGLRIQSTANTKMIAWARNDAGGQEIYSDLSAEVSNIDTTLSTSATLMTSIPLNSALERAIVITGDTKGAIKKLSGTFNVTMVVTTNVSLLGCISIIFFVRFLSWFLRRKLLYASNTKSTNDNIHYTVEDKLFNCEVPE
jgi:hypothetical protein